VLPVKRLRLVERKSLTTSTGRQAGGSKNGTYRSVVRILRWLRQLDDRAAAGRFGWLLKPRPSLRDLGVRRPRR
jgi:hypothetical protein